MEPMMTPEEQFFFENAFRQSVDAVATVLEKPEFNQPKVQNLVMLELIGHIALSMHSGAKTAGPDVEDAALETLSRYLMFLVGVLAEGGIEALPERPSSSKAVN